MLLLETASWNINEKVIGVSGVDFSQEFFLVRFLFSSANFFYNFAVHISRTNTNSKRRPPPTLTTPPSPTPLSPTRVMSYDTLGVRSKRRISELDSWICHFCTSRPTLAEIQSCRYTSHFFFLLLLIVPHNERHPTLNSHRRYRHTNCTWFCCETVRLFCWRVQLRSHVSSFSSFSFLRFLFFVSFTTVQQSWDIDFKLTKSAIAV